jgi:uncharacterized membrane protein (DUF485 family)
MWLILAGALAGFIRGAFLTINMLDAEAAIPSGIFGNAAVPPLIANILQYATFFMSPLMLLIGSVMTSVEFESRAILMRRIHVGVAESVITQIAAAFVHSLMYAAAALIVGWAAQAYWDLTNPQFTFLIPDGIIWNLFGKFFVCFSMAFIIALIGVLIATVVRSVVSSIFLSIIAYIVMTKITAITYLGVFAFADGVMPILAIPELGGNVSQLRVALIGVFITAFLLTGIMYFGTRPIYDRQRRKKRKEHKAPRKAVAV